MLEIPDVHFLCNLIRNSKGVLGEDWLWGSPKDSTLVWKVPDWNITYTRARVAKDSNTKVKLFGKVFRFGITYYRHELSHPAYEIELREIIQWRRKPHGLEANWDYSPLMELDYDGDVESLMDAIVYWKLQQSLD